MKKLLMTLLMLVFLTPGLVFSDIVTFKVGYFFPRANSDLWETEFENLALTKTDYNSSNFGFAYEYFLTNQIGIQLSIDGYSRRRLGFYQGFVGISDIDGDWAYPDDFQEDFFPNHSFSVSITPVQLSVKLSPLGRSNRFIPFIGGGVGLYIWSARLQGDLIDFGDPYIDLDFDVEVYPIDFADIRDDNNLDIGFHALGGFMFPIANQISIEGEVKYNFISADLNDFVGFEPFDLSGFQVTFGMNYWF